MNATARRQAIWYTLCARRYATINSLARRFNVSRTTIKDDVCVLSLSYPIVTIRGRNGGVALAEWYTPGSMALTPGQFGFLLRLSENLTGDDARIMVDILTQLARPSERK